MIGWLDKVGYYSGNIGKALGGGNTG